MKVMVQYICLPNIIKISQWVLSRAFEGGNLLLIKNDLSSVWWEVCNSLLPKLHFLPLFSSIKRISIHNFCLEMDGGWIDELTPG